VAERLGSSCSVCGLGLDSVNLPPVPFNVTRQPLLSRSSHAAVSPHKSHLVKLHIPS
jgi:hypothetical protein